MDGWLNGHQYPAFLLRHPSLIRLIYFWNHLVLQRNRAARRSLSALLPLLKKGAVVVDAGCGEGLHLFPHAGRLADIHFIGIDKNKGHIRFCRQYAKREGLLNTSFLHQQLEKPLPGLSTDLIVCVGTMQYVPDDRVVFSNFYKTLKKGGKVVLYVPINGKMLTRAYRFYFDKKKHYEKKQERKRIYTEKEIINKVKDAGFDIVSKKYTYNNMGILGHEWYSLLLMGMTNSKYFSWFFILLLFLFTPLILLLVNVDYFTKKNNGNGLLLILKK